MFCQTPHELNELDELSSRRVGEWCRVLASCAGSSTAVPSPEGVGLVVALVEGVAPRWRAGGLRWGRDGQDSGPRRRGAGRAGVGSVLRPQSPRWDSGGRRGDR